MATTRIRSRTTSQGAYSGTSYWRIRTPATVNQTIVTTRYEQCTDVVGNKRNPNGFHLISRTRGTPCLISGKLYSGSPQTLQKEYVNWPPNWLSDAADPPSWSPSSLELSNHAFSVQEGTNPSAPHVSVPTFFGEMKDVPSLVKGFGDDLIRQIERSRSYYETAVQNVPKGYLTWRWAVRPMMSDIRKLVDFQRAVHKRFEAIKTLKNTGWLYRRFQLGSTSETTNLTNVTVESSLGELFTLGRTQTVTTTTWGTCRWKTTSGYTALPSTPTQQLALAERLTYGITGYEALAAAWELIPWSWFIDWFAGVGDIISANNNTLKLLPGSYCVMRRGETTLRYHLVSKPSWATCLVLPTSVVTTRKQRFTSNLALPPSPALTPLISGDKWSILASLAAVRVKTTR